MSAGTCTRTHTRLSRLLSCPSSSLPSVPPLFPESDSHQPPRVDLTDGRLERHFIHWLTDWLTDAGEKGDEGLWSVASSPREPFLRPDGIKFIGRNIDGWSQIHVERRDVQEKKKIVLLQHRRQVWVFWAMVGEMADGNSSVWKKKSMQIGKYNDPLNPL